MELFNKRIHMFISRCLHHELSRRNLWTVGTRAHSFGCRHTSARTHTLFIKHLVKQYKSRKAPFFSILPKHRGFLHRCAPFIYVPEHCDNTLICAVFAITGWNIYNNLISVYNHLLIWGSVTQLIHKRSTIKSYHVKDPVGNMLNQIEDFYKLKYITAECGTLVIKH